jgi:SAM-dependent methyltransferase
VGSEADIDLIDRCIRGFVQVQDPSTPITVLDFGCGEGTLVRGLGQRGYKSFGCDIAERWERGDARLKSIERNPYRLPYEDQSFDVVFSTSVLEHVLNKEESLQEIGRVLRRNGITIHLFPSKYYLPYEPHLFVPLLNYLWPRVPRWYLAFWALVGIRNQHQRHMTWREVVNANDKFCRERLSYWSLSKYEECVTKLIGECVFPMPLVVRYSKGRASRIVGSLFGSRLGGTLLALFRYPLLVARKRSE